MRRPPDGMWQGLVHGQWLAHERRMQLLELAREIQSEEIAEARAASTRDRLAREAERAGCKARRTAELPLVRLHRTLVGSFGRGRPVLDGAVPGRHAQ
jgi:hypothetical protein